MTTQEMPHSFLSFPDEEELVRCLRREVPADGEAEGLFEAIAARLAGTTYDHAGFTFLLMEILYEAGGGGLTRDLLPRCVEALSRDPELGRTASEAWEEIQRSLAEE